MAWTRTGTVNLVNGSNVVTGVGSQFLTDGMIGDGFRGPNGAIYEVTNIATQTSLTIQPAYEGPTVNGALYFLAPFQGYNKDTALALRQANVNIAAIPGTKQDKSDTLSSLSSIGTAAQAADRVPYFTSPGAMALAVFTAKSRLLLARTDALGMQAELGLVPVTSLSDTTAGRLLVPGSMGLGGDAITISAANAVTNLRKSGYYYAAATGDTPESYGFVTHVNIGPNDAHQDFHGIVTGIRYMRTLFNGTWTAWGQVITAQGAIKDPSTSNEGLMSTTNVSGFYLHKYANGRMDLLGPFANSAVLAANSNVLFDVTIPNVLNQNYYTSVYASLSPTNTWDVGGWGVQLISATQARILVRNGATAQAFSGTLQISGRWK